MAFTTALNSLRNQAQFKDRLEAIPIFDKSGDLCTLLIVYAINPSLKIRLEAILVFDNSGDLCILLNSFELCAKKLHNKEIILSLENLHYFDHLLLESVIYSYFSEVQGLIQHLINSSVQHIYLLPPLISPGLSIDNGEQWRQYYEFMDQFDKLTWIFVRRVSILDKL